MVRPKFETGQGRFPLTGNPRGCTERMNVKRWMRDWQERFGSLGVDVIVADVAQSSVVVNVPEKAVILSPNLAMYTAERILGRLYHWWHHQREQMHHPSCALVSR